VRPPRFLGAVRRQNPTGPAEPRFADSFARHPGLPRITRLPNRRAWSTTAVLAALVAGGIFTVPLLGRIGSNQPQAAYAADAPVTSTIPGGMATARGGEPAPGSHPTTAPAGLPPRAPGPQIIQRPGVTVTGPPSGVTATIAPPGQRLPGTATRTANPPQQGRPVAQTTTGTAPRSTRTTTQTTTSSAPKPPGPTTATTTTSKPPQVQSAPRATGVAVQNYGSNRCIDVKDAQSGVGKDGAPLQLWDCAQSSNQKWAFNSDGSVRSLGLCMDLAWASTAENTQVQLVTCNGARLVLRSCAGTSNQKWHKM
jgi:hypothetical protein